jgi:hypothetical protein
MRASASGDDDDDNDFSSKAEFFKLCTAELERADS